MEGPAQTGTTPIQAADFAAALGWWRDAGVDLDFADAPTCWLPQVTDGPVDAPPPPVIHRPAAAAELISDVSIGGESAQWPTTLEQFAPWWQTEPALDGGSVRGRVPPRGPAGAEIMVIVPQPEAADSDTLLAGAEGRLLAAMRAAMQVDPAQVYFASALPRHTPLADWAALGRAGLGRVLAHHIALVQPQRLIVLGSNILPLLGHDPAQNANVLSQFNHQNRKVALLGSRDLSAMMGRPAWKAAFWQAWLEFDRGFAGDLSGPSAVNRTGNENT